MLPEGLTGRYRALRELGRGGFGRVILAEDAELGRSVALKLLDELVAADPDTLRRFEREGRVTARLRHPHVVQVLDVGLAPVPHIVYEFVEGPSLAALVRRTPPSVDDVRRWGVELGGALAAAHDTGIVHRDVKPENVLVRPTGETVLCDFGVARSQRAGTCQTVDGVILGTPAFMAPELFTGEPPTPASDQFALAATLFLLLYGRPVWGGGDLATVLAAATGKVPIVVPPGFRGKCPRLESALLVALGRDPAERHPDMAAFVAGLEVAPEEPEAASTVRFQDPGPAPPRPGFRSSAVVALVALALISLPLAWWVGLSPRVRGLYLGAVLRRDSAAAVELGTCYESGLEGLAADPGAARRWYLRSIEGAEPTEHGLLGLGRLAEGGADGRPDLEAAEGWYRRAVQVIGSGSSWTALGAFLARTDVAAGDAAEARSALERALELGEGERAPLFLAELLVSGRLATGRDLPGAVELLLACHGRGQPWALVNLAMIVGDPTRGVGDEELCRLLLDRAWLHARGAGRDEVTRRVEDLLAARGLAPDDARARAVPEDVVLARLGPLRPAWVSWRGTVGSLRAAMAEELLAAASEGDGALRRRVEAALPELGELLQLMGDVRQGRVPGAEPGLARRIYPHLLGKSCGWGEVGLAEAWRDGAGGEVSRLQAARLFEAAAGQGNGEALVFLGNLYREGLDDGAPRVAEAMACYRRARELGSSWGSYALAEAAEEGWEGPPDRALARGWYAEALARGLAAAAEGLARCEQAATASR